MTFWWWVLVYGGIAVAALVLYGLLGLGLWRTTKQLKAEIGRLSQLVANAERTMRPVDEDDWDAAAARQPIG